MSLSISYETGITECNVTQFKLLQGFHPGIDLASEIFEELLSISDNWRKLVPYFITWFRVA